MKLYQKLTCLAAAAALVSAAFPLQAEVNDTGKNVLNVEWRYLPPEYDKLPAVESEKWNFNFRPYGKEAAAQLWTDPNTIRNISTEENTEAAESEPTSVYACCDEKGLTILVYGIHKPAAPALKDGKILPWVRLETFILPGDADDPVIQNYHPFGFHSIAPYLEYNLSWMKWDRKNRPLIETVQFDTRPAPHGTVCKIFYPWLPLWDKLPFTKKKDNFWRLCLIRFGRAAGAVTWGGPVHQQVSPGYLRMPDFTQAQKTAIMKNVLVQIWNRYAEFRDSCPVNPDKITGRNDHYRLSIKDQPHSWMNVNEDFGFQDAWLLQAIAERNALGAGIADFEKMSPEEQEAFYDKASKLLYNFNYDIQDAYAKYLKSQIMKR